MMRFQLPYPPSGWDLYKGWGKTRSLSTTYKKWRNDAGYFIKRPETPISVPFSISIALRNKDADERAEEEAVLNTYLVALGMQPDLFDEAA